MEKTSFNPFANSVNNNNNEESNFRLGQPKVHNNNNNSNDENMDVINELHKVGTERFTNKRKPLTEITNNNMKIEGFDSQSKISINANNSMIIDGFDLQLETLTDTDNLNLTDNRSLLELSPAKKKLKKGHNPTNCKIIDDYFEKVTKTAYEKLKVPTYNNHILNLTNSIGNSNLVINGIKPKFTLCGTGKFVKAFEIDAKKSVHTDLNNKELLVKSFYKKIHEDELSQLIEISMCNHDYASRFLPCALTYNFPKKDKYYLVENVPFEIKLSNVYQLEQIQMIFQIAFRYRISCNLSYSHLRVDRLGQVKLINNAMKFFNFDNKKELGADVIPMLESWCEAVRITHEGVPGIEVANTYLRYFTKDLGFHESWYSTAYANVFGLEAYEIWQAENMNQYAPVNNIQYPQINNDQNTNDYVQDFNTDKYFDL